MALNPPPDAIEAQLGELTLYLGIDEAVIAGPPGATELELPGDPEAIRAHVRFDANGRYRPFSGLRNLRPGWYARFRDLESFSGAVDAVYPLAQRHAAMWADGELEVTSLDALFERQSGRYAIASQLSPRGREHARRLLCGVCARVPLWAGEVPVADGAIPCPEPCSVMLSLCREAALWEDETPAAAPVDPEIPFAAFEQPGNPLREAYLQAMEGRS